MTKILTQSALIAAMLGSAMFKEDTVGVAGSTTAAANASTPSGGVSGAEAEKTPAAVAPPAPNEYVEMTKVNFHFKKEKDTKDETGKVLAVGAKHPSVEMFLPIPKLSRIVQYIAEPEKYAKEIELLNGAIFDVVYGQARAQVNDYREKNPKDTVTNAVLNYDKLDWTAIANMPKSERGAYAPDESEVEAFVTSYAEVMPAAAQKSPEAIANHVKLFKDGFKKQRGQKEILELFDGMLSVYLASAPQEAVEDNLQVVEYFQNKLQRWIKAEATVTMDML
jgi:hypothetical protein